MSHPACVSDVTNVTCVTKVCQNVIKVTESACVIDVTSVTDATSSKLKFSNYSRQE